MGTGSDRSPIRADEIVVLTFYALLFAASGIATGVDGRALLRSLPIAGAVAVQCALTFDLVLTRGGRFRGSREALKSWWPAMMGPLGYETLRRLDADRITIALGLSPKDELMMLADEKLFGAAAPLFFQGMIADWVSHVMWFFYIFGFMLGPFAVLAYFYFCQKSTRAFYEARLVIIATFLGGYLLYLLIPVAGPMALIPDQVRFPIAGGYGMKELFEGTGRYLWDCFPSLHAAVPWAVVLVAFRHVPNWLRAVLVFSALVITWSAVYLRFHWGVDLIAGIVWAWLVWAVAIRIPVLIAKGAR